MLHLLSWTMAGGTVSSLTPQKADSIEMKFGVLDMC